MGGLLVAMDGPAGSGKSSVARAVAQRLGLINLNTGATYRAVAMAALRDGVDLADRRGLVDLAANLELDGEGVLVGGERVPEEALRTPEVAAAASKVSAVPELRRVLVERQRESAESAARSGGAVVEGRDIGTVVLPDAPLKVYLSAAPEERARRRATQTNRQDELERIQEAMRARDKRDAERSTSPLKPADDAVCIDTTGLSLEDVVARVVKLARRAEAGPAVRAKDL